MPLSGYCTELRIGATLAGLLELQHRGIEAPDAWTFAPYSVQRVCGNGEQKGYGFATASWSWPVLNQESLNRLLGFFSADTDASILLFISTYTDVGTRQETSDYEGYMHRPVDGEGKALYPQSRWARAAGRDDPLHPPGGCIECHCRRPTISMGLMEPHCPLGTQLGPNLRARSRSSAPLCAAMARGVASSPVPVGTQTRSRMTSTLRPR